MTHEKIPVNSEKKYTFHGYFKVRETYNYINNYLENSLNYWDVTEVDFEEKNIDGNRNLTTRVEAEKIYNDYFKIVIKYEMKMEGKDIEIKDKNKIIKMTKGTAKLTINSYVVPDWGAERHKGPFRMFLGQIYDKFVGTDDLDKCMGSAAGDVGQVVARFKEHMNSTIK